MNRSVRKGICGIVCRVAVVAVLAIGLLGGESAGAQDGGQRPTPLPVSGRDPSSPDKIIPADVLARIELLRDNLELIRVYMGRPEAPAPLLRVEGAQPREVYSQALNLESRANRLAFEHLRIDRSTSGLRQEARTIDVFSVVDSALAAVLLVKRDLGIEVAVAEKPSPDATLPSEVFNATVAAETEIDNILRQHVSPSDVFIMVTDAVHRASAMHASVRGGPSLPLEPQFVPNKTPTDVYTRLVRCFQLVQKIASTQEIEILNFRLPEGEARQVLPSDVSAIAALLAEELAFLHSRTEGAGEPARAYHPGLRFPSHVYQRAGMLELVLKNLVQKDLSATVKSRVESDG